MSKLTIGGIVVITIFYSFPTYAVNWGNCATENGLTAIADTKSSTTVTPSNPIVDPQQTFVLAQATGDMVTRQTVDHFVTAEVDAANDVAFTRFGTSGDAEISYSIIQCSGNDKFRVQRGTINLAPGALTATGSLAAPVDPSRSLVTISIRSNAASPADADSLVTGALQDPTTVIIQRATTAPSSLRVHYQVIEFTPLAGVQLQTNETTLSPGSASTTVTLTTAAALDRTWVYCTYDATDNGLQQTAVGCALTDPSTVTVYRAAASAYTNRVRIYTITWPGNTVNVFSGTDSFDSTALDNTQVDHTITLSTAISEYLSFPYVTHTTTGTGTEYPRNRWLTNLPSSTELLLRFYRSDPAGNSDATTFYWQVIQFPPPYQATGWGWVGNAVGPDLLGTILISFNGISTTGVDYGVSLERGGCGSACNVSGQAWVGTYDTNDGLPYATIGMIDFDPDVSSGPPVTLGDDPTTPENDSLGAYWNEETGELYGWARFRALEDYEDNLGGIANDWGWVKLRGTETTGGAEYGVDFSPESLEFSGWAWNDNGTQISSSTEEDGSGFGWLKFDLDTSGTVAQAWLRTTQANIYSRQGFNLSTPSPSGEYNATYLILSNGSVAGVSTQLGSVITQDLGGLPIDNSRSVFRGALGTIYFNELIDQADHIDIVGDCDDSLLTNNSNNNPLSGDIFYCAGDLTISNNVTFYNGTGSAIGSGTIIVGGDLIIEDNLNYYNTTIDQHINNLASVAWIVQGRVEIHPAVTEIVGAFIVLGTATSPNYDFVTGDSTLPLAIQGLVLARSFNFQRVSLGATPDPEPGEDIRYDGRVFANPPPGLEDFASLIPEFN